MKQHPENFFVIWTNAPCVEGVTTLGRALNSKSFCKWAKDTLATGLDPIMGAFPENIYVFDFFSKLADTNGYLHPQYAMGPTNSHPNPLATELVAPQFVNEIFDATIVYENYISAIPGLWMGITNSDWGTTSNWANGSIPDSSNNVTIENVSNKPVINTIGTQCNNMTIKDGATLTINQGKGLTVNGTLTNNAGTTGLVIKSDASGTGSLIHSTAGVDATIERYIPAHGGIAGLGYHLLSSPVDNQAIAPNFTVTPATDYDFYKWQIDPPYWLNQKVGVNYITNFTNGVGYLVAYATAGTHNFVGTMNVSDFSPAINFAPTIYGPWNLIGNPYACALDGDMTSWTKVNVNNVVYLMDGSDNTFKVWNGVAGNLPNHQIPAMQGFWVSSNSSGASLTIPASAKTHSSNNFYKTTTLENHLILNVESPNTTKDVAFIYFKDENSNGIDVNMAY